MRCEFFQIDLLCTLFLFFFNSFTKQQKKKITPTIEVLHSLCGDSLLEVSNFYVQNRESKKSKQNCTTNTFKGEVATLLWSSSPSFFVVPKC
jgi:hypothetical protein